MKLTDELLLNYIGLMTLALLLLTLIIFITLVVWRLFSNRRKDTIAIRKSYIQQLLLTHLENPLQHPIPVLFKKENDTVLIAETALDLFRVLKGKSRERLIDALVQAGVYDWCQQQITSTNTRQRVIAIQLIAHWPEKHVITRLLGLLRGKNIINKTIVHLAILESLSVMGDIKLLPVVINELSRKKRYSPAVISSVIQKFGVSVIMPLADIIKSPKAPVPIRIAGLLTMLRLAKPSLIAEIGILLHQHQNQELRTLAFFALAQSGESIPDSVIEHGERNGAWLIRQYTADCAANSSRHIGTLKRLMSDQNWLVGFHAAQMLFGLGTAGISLLKICAAKDDAAAKRAQIILAEKQETYEPA